VEDRAKESASTNEMDFGCLSNCKVRNDVKLRLGFEYFNQFVFAFGFCVYTLSQERRHKARVSVHIYLYKLVLELVCTFISLLVGILMQRDSVWVHWQKIGC
jgi:hypothetical protein